MRFFRLYLAVCLCFGLTACGHEEEQVAWDSLNYSPAAATAKHEKDKGTCDNDINNCAGSKR